MDGPDFSFPFEPYDIQLEFMQALYSCIDDGNIGIFESPTGQSGPRKCVSTFAKFCQER
jgi:chromosome transmission fidelity protein 1